MDQNIQIVDASSQDADEIGKIREQTWLDSYPNSDFGITKEDIQNKINQWNDEFIVDKIQGKDSHTWVGTKLLKIALDWLENSKKIIIDVVSYNEKAINFYKKFGFIETGKQSQDFLVLPSGKTIPKILMVKGISGRV